MSTGALPGTRLERPEVATLRLELLVSQSSADTHTHIYTEGDPERPLCQLALKFVTLEKKFDLGRRGKGGGKRQESGTASENCSSIKAFMREPFSATGSFVISN